MKIFSFFLALIFLSGCNSKNIKKENTAPVNATSDQKTTEIYNLFLENETYKLKKFEPKNNIYNGILLEENEKNSILNFENQINAKHSIYLYNLNLGEEYPLSWILNCYSKYKTPFITILPPEDITQIFDTNLLEKTAKDFGNLDIPIFLNFYPVSEKIAISPEEYKNFFKLAKTYFSMYAKNICFVWSVNSNFAYNSKDFYPGDEYTDWVGINIEENILENNELNIIFNELDTFYKTYEKTKPIAISYLAISHFSNKTLNYNIEKKIKELERFYSYIPFKYPRIKMINYINYDNFKEKEKTNKQNYSLTDNKDILKKYKELIENKIFLSNVIINKNEIINKEKIKIPFLIYKKDNSFFLSAEAIRYLGYENSLSTFKEYFIDSYTLFSLAEFLNKTNFKIELDEKNNNIFLK